MKVFEHKISNYFEKMIIGYFIFSSIFLTIRILLIGADESSVWYQQIIALLPEFFIGLVLLLFAIKVKAQQKLLKFTLFDYIFIGYIVSNIILGLILANNLKISLYAIRMTYLPMIFYFFSRFGFSYNKDETEKIVGRIIYWYAVVAVAGIILYFFLPNLEEFLIKKANGELKFFFIKRMGSIFWTPVLLGSFMSIGLIFFQYKLYKEKKIVYYFLIALFWTCLYLSISRGAIIVTFIGIVLLFAIFRKVKIFLFSLLTIVAVVGIILIVQPRTAYLFGWVPSSCVETINESQYIVGGSNNINVTRVNYWSKSLEDFTNNPMGYGLGKAGHVGNRFFKHTDKTASTYSTDGWYLKLANETGIWGILSYLILALFFFIKLVKAWLKEKQSLYALFLVIFITVSMQNIVSNVNDFYSFSSLFWLIVGAAHYLIIQTKNANS